MSHQADHISEWNSFLKSYMYDLFKIATGNHNALT